MAFYDIHARSMMEQLRRSAEYAINSKSRNLVYETYGAAKMAWACEAISKEEFYELNELLVVQTLNNGRLMNEWHKEVRG